MPNELSLITTIAAGFGLALLLGYGATRLKMPPLVGYLLAGVAIGPATPGFVADVALAGRRPCIVVEQNRERIEGLRQRSQPAVWGDASDPAVLVQAHVARASMLVVATPDTFDVRRMAHAARLLNPEIEIVVRTHNAEEAALLEGEQVARAFVGEQALADSMAEHVLGLRAAQPASAR